MPRPGPWIWVRREASYSQFQSKNYQIDKLLDPTAKFSSIQDEQKSDYSFLDEDQYQNMNEVKEIQLKEEDPMNNIAPSTPTGQGGASKQMPTSRSSHPTRDLYRTDKRNIILNISVVEALPLSAVGT